MTDWLDRLRPLLSGVEVPAQYLGGEHGQVVKGPEEATLRWALLFPDTYAIGMSHLGLKILYGILNGLPGVAAERCFAPWHDMEAAQRAAGVPLLTLETHTPVRDFDVVGISLQYELSYTNVLAMLDLAEIPLLAADRGEEHPLVLGGGTNAFHPEPLADFFDLFLLGDGEEAVVDLAELFGQPGLDRRSRIVEAARGIRGVYAPALYEPRYGGDGRLEAVAPILPGVPDRVEPAHLSSLEDADFPTRPPVPFTRVTQDRVAIEVMRGCTQGCRFCQAGMLKRPNRLRSVERVLEIARESYRSTGHDEISLLSLSTADYPHLVELIGALDREFRDRKVKLSVPSLRVNETLKAIPGMTGRFRKAGLTIAPEVATDRLRAVIDKNITNEDLYAGVREAYRNGWRAVKLYFMIGLPTETDEDVAEIISMGRRVSELGREYGGAPGQVTLAVANFVPKPHSPFQWEPMEREEALKAKRDILYRLVRRHPKLRLRVHPTGPSIMEGLLARGDRHLGRVLLRLFRAGARFDAWDESFDRERWDRALAEEGVDLDRLLHRPFEVDEVLPWDHLGAPVSRAYLEEERSRSQRGERTRNCMDGKCNHCGVDVGECAPSRKAYRNPDAADHGIGVDGGGHARS